MPTHDGKKTPIFSDDMTKKDKRTAKACIFTMAVGSYLSGIIATATTDKVAMFLGSIILWFSVIVPIIIGAENGLIIAKRKE